MALDGSGIYGEVISAVNGLLEIAKNRPATVKNSSSIVVLATLTGNFELAAQHLVNAVGDNVLGATAIRTYYYYTGDWSNTKPALRALISRFKNLSTSLVRTTEPQRLELAYGQYGSPLRFEEGEMFSLDANIFKLIALETIADVMSTKDIDVSNTYRAAYEELKHRVEEELYNEENGIYMSRHTYDGAWSSMYGIGSMLAPLAGLTDKRERLENVLISLKAQNRFSAFTGVPTLPRSNYFFDKPFVNWNGLMAEEYRSGGGMVSPILNFLVYLGLRRYGVHSVAAELAEKGYDAFVSEAKNGVYPSYFMPNWNQSTSPKKQSVRAAFMPIMSLIQDYSVDLYGRGLCFGTKKKEGVIEGFVFDRRTGDVVFGENATAIVYKDGEEERFFVGAKAVIANYREDDSEVSFVVDVGEEAQFKLTYPLFRKKGAKTVECRLEAGKTHVVINAETGEIFLNKFNS